LLKKAVVLSVVCLLLLVTTAPVSAMLKVLEPKLSEELQGIAKAHLVRTENIAAAAIDIQEGWVQEYWNTGVEVYNVVAVIDKGLATERKIQIPVRVDQKVVLSDAEMTALKEKDKALAPEQPVMRILMAPDEAGVGGNKSVGDQPVSQPGGQAYDQPLKVSQAAAKDPGLPSGAEPAQTAANDINTTSVVRDDARSAAEAVQAGAAGYTAYYLAAGLIALLFSGTAFALKRGRARYS
jgi:hypothetical protein